MKISERGADMKNKREEKKARDGLCVKSHTNFHKPVVLQISVAFFPHDLIVAYPNTTVEDKEAHYVINEGLALRMVIWGAEGLVWKRKF